MSIAACEKCGEHTYVTPLHGEKWLLDTAETAVIRHGAEILQIDPWNRLESTKPPRESEPGSRRRSHRGHGT